MNERNVPGAGVVRDLTNVSLVDTVKELRHWHVLKGSQVFLDAADLLEMQDGELGSQGLYIDTLRTRLEVDGASPYDGIATRDETIKGLDKIVDEQRAELRRLGSAISDGDAKRVADTQRWNELLDQQRTESQCYAHDARCTHVALEIEKKLRAEDCAYARRLHDMLIEIRNEERQRLQPGEYSSLADRIDRQLGFIEIEGALAQSGRAPACQAVGQGIEAPTPRHPYREGSVHDGIEFCAECGQSKANELHSDDARTVDMQEGPTADLSRPWAGFMELPK